jgi:hypothetical protein
MPVAMFFVLVSSSTYAANNTSAQSGQQVQQQGGTQGSGTYYGSPSPMGNQVQNQNEVSTQNQGEETQLQVTTQEMEQLMEEMGETQNLGSQVKILAQEQVQAQTQIQTQLDKLESKTNLMKKIFGPDYGAIKNLKQLMEQNRLRIQQLTELQNQVTNQADENQLEEAIQALIDQNTSLEDQVNAEERIGSIFGWFVRLFYN